jgi:hypothetical protein
METSLPPTEALLSRIKSEFLEMPGLRLNESQARRLWNLDAESCASVLAALLAERFLFLTRDGAFMRIERAAPLKAALPSAITTAVA